MRADSGRWHEVTESVHAHERLGLEHVRHALPDTEPYRAWTNFSFTSPKDGRVFEVDLLVLGPAGLHMVELKAWSGTISGFDRTWYELQPGWSKPITRTNPVHLVNEKAKVFKGYLEAAARRAKGHVDIPWVTESVFLHGTAVNASGLPESVRQKVYGLENERGNGLRRLVTDGLTAAPFRGGPVDGQHARAVERLLKDIGLARRPKEVKVGPWLIEDDELDSGWGWIDSPAHHSSFAEQRARVRRWFSPPGAGRNEIATLRNAASREFQLLGGLDHPGLVTPSSFEEIDGGVGALVYRDLEGRQDLDAWVASNATSGLDARLDLVRQLAEVMRYAHEHGLAHRGLGPRAVTIRDVDGRPTLAVRDWQSAGRVSTEQTSSTHHAAALAEHGSPAARVYQAPEVLRGLSTDRRAADVFAVGALAYLVLTGQPPAGSEDGLTERLSSDDGLLLSAHLDSVTQEVEDVVWEATQARVDQRTASMSEMLAQVDVALDRLTTPPATASEQLDPLEAPGGTEVAPGITVRRRLGEGSTSVALLVDHHGTDRVLKVAKDADKSEKLRAEAEVLARVPASPRMAKLVEGPLEIAGRVCLVIEQAGDKSLSDHLRAGRLNLDQLRRWGRDLLEALTHLGAAGIEHRDVKPANLGVRTLSDGKPHLILFDFSLASVPSFEIGVGTPGYRDPFLGVGKRRRYDPDAELFTAAVTLHEMATGRLPQWGDGRTDPALLDTEVDLDTRLFDPSIGTELVEVLSRALARDVERRYDTPGDLAAAWDRVFEEADVDRPDDADARAAAAELMTPLEDSGLSPRALSALEQLQVVTVADLLDLDPMELPRLRGASQPVKSEITERAVTWRERLAVADVPTRVSVDAVIGRLIDGAPSDLGRRVLSLMLGRTDPDTKIRIDPGSSVKQVADELDTDVAAVRAGWHEVLTRTTTRPDVLGLVDDVTQILEQLDEIATFDEIASRVLARRGSHASGEKRSAQALGLTRLAVNALERDELVTFRLSGSVRVVVGATAWDDPDGVLDDVRELAEAATSLALGDDLASPATCVSTIRTRATSEVTRLSDRRLVELAAAASTAAAVSSRGEVYPINLSAGRAVAICAPSLVTGGPIADTTVRARVKARFPLASDLPPARDLERLLDATGLDLVWHASDQLFLPRSYTHSMTHAVSSTAHPSGLTSSTVDQALSRSIQERGFLALGVAQANAVAARRRLSALGVSVVDVSSRLVTSLRADAQSSGGDWRFVLGVDAQPSSSAERRQLAGIVRTTATRLLDEIATDNRPLLLLGAEVLARYDCVDLLAPLADMSRDRAASRWLLAVQATVGGSDLGGAAIPLAAVGQWLELPSSWSRQPMTITDQRDLA